MEFREPVSFFYNLFLPLTVFGALIFLGKDRPESFESTLTPFVTICSYIAYSAGSYGTGILLAGWRENGVFITFCQNQRAVGLLWLCQSVARGIAAALYALIFLAGAVLYFGEFPGPIFWKLPLLLFFLTMLTAFASILFMVPRWSPRDLGSLNGGLLFTFLYLSSWELMGDSVPWAVQTVNCANPVFLNSVLLDWLVGNGALPDLRKAVVTFSLLITAAFVGTRKFQPHPVLLRL